MSRAGSKILGTMKALEEVVSTDPPPSNSPSIDVVVGIIQRLQWSCTQADAFGMTWENNGYKFKITTSGNKLTDVVLFDPANRPTNFMVKASVFGGTRVDIDKLDRTVSRLQMDALSDAAASISGRISDQMASMLEAFGDIAVFDRPTALTVSKVHAQETLNKLHDYMFNEVLKRKENSGFQSIPNGSDQDREFMHLMEPLTRHWMSEDHNYSEKYFIGQAQVERNKKDRNLAFENGFLLHARAHKLAAGIKEE